MKSCKLLLSYFSIVSLLSFCFCSGPGSNRTSNQVGEDTSNHKADTTISQSDSVSKKTSPKVCVFIENSGSMKGYVKGVTDFESFIYDYLMKVDLNYTKNSFEFNYINSKIEPSENNDLKSFIKNTEPTDFNGGSSDIASMIDLILSNTDQNTVSMFISDCIFSPGKGKNAYDYLKMQSTEIEYAIAKYLRKQSNAAVMMYHLNSNFDGLYFNCEDKPQQIKNVRPYYIWFFGTNDNLNKLKNSVPENSLLQNIENSFFISRYNQEINYAIAYNSGNFDLNRNNVKHSIIDLKKDQSGFAKFSINVDFSKLLVDETYILDTANYEINGGRYKIESIEKNVGGEYSHRMKITTDFVSAASLEIRLKKQDTPQWINDLCTEDCDISNETMSKTYGFKYLVDGIRKPFYETGEFYTTLIININN